MKKIDPVNIKQHTLQPSLAFATQHPYIDKITVRIPVNDSIKKIVDPFTIFVIFEFLSFPLLNL